MKAQSRAGTRRMFLRTVASAGITGLAGCMSSGRRGGSGNPTNSNENGNNGGGEQSTTIAILAAGSLQNALLNGLQSAVNVPVQVETHGSATVARMIDEGLRDPDIVSLADTALFNQPLAPPWYSVFTSNAIVIAYNEDTTAGQRIAEAGTDGWYKPLLEDDVTLGRTDPAQDPLGYRALFMLELASRYYEDARNLREKIPKRKQIYPETALISQFETGALDAAIAYRNMAVERDYSYIGLPDQIDLSNPKYVDEWYSTVSYTLPSGKNIHGDLIAYGSTIRKGHMSNAALTVFDVHTTGDYLKEFGFLLRKQFPTYKGNVPNRVRQAVSQSERSRSIGSVRRPDRVPAVSGITILI